MSSRNIGIWRMRSQGGEPELVKPLPLNGGPGFPQWSPDGRTIYYQSAGNLWSMPADGRSERQLTDLTGRRGSMANECIATDGTHLYFGWQEDLGDIWVMDVVYD